MQFRETAHQGESQSGAFMLAVQARIELDKGLEQPSHLLRVHPNTRVFHDKTDDARFGVSLNL